MTMTKTERLAIHCSGGLRPPEIGDQRSPLQGAKTERWSAEILFFATFREAARG